MTDVGLIPDDWDAVSLGELFDFKNGFNANKSRYGRGIKFVNVFEIINHRQLDETRIPGEVSVSAAEAKPFVVLQGDVLFNRTSETQEEVGLSAVYLGKNAVIFGGFVIRGRPKNDALALSYRPYGFSHPGVRRQIIAKGQGAVRANIGQVELASVVIPLPPPPEQQAIADVLSKAETLITSLETLVLKKRALKQGAVQQLLTGRKRLAGFEDEWCTTTVGQQFQVQLGKMLDAEKNKGVLKPFLGNRSVQWGRIDVNGLGQMKFRTDELEKYRLKKGDLLVCEGGEVGRAAIWEEQLGECYYQKALHRLRPLHGFNSYLMLCFLEFWASSKKLDNFVTQTSIAHLPKEKLEEIPLPLPSLLEQQAIASVLSDMDAEIKALEGRLFKARLLKQGMMQELLTGRTRLV